MKTLTCKGCGGEVAPTFYKTHVDQIDGRTREMVYYECPLCGPGRQNGPEDAGMPRAFPAPATIAP
ncbi:hypothetical protein [Botrimarina sp.]|uniref:hypothetical protein n=1 Tax=Botrimarina sp. TaxID=2795802 RepID=UPI0032EDC10C